MAEMNMRSCFTAVSVMAALALSTGCDRRDANTRGAERKVASLEKDPASVQFRNERKCADGFTLTGEVNGKNSLGAYTSFKRFWARDYSAVIEDESEPAETQAAELDCHKSNAEWAKEAIKKGSATK